MVATVTYWLLLPEVWVILGIVFVVIELLLGTAYFLLSLGVAALLFSALLFLQEKGIFLIFEDWMDVAIAYGLMSLIAVVLLKLFFQDRSKIDDINKY